MARPLTCLTDRRRDRWRCFRAAIELPEVRRNADGHHREHDVSEEATGVTLRSERIDDRSEKRRNDEAAERTKSADNARCTAHCLRYIFGHHLEHRRIADPHSEGDQ